MKTLQGRIGYFFKDEKYLLKALTHTSYANEHRTGPLSHNQRLEFLGDAVLGFVAAEHLYKKHEGSPEGRLSKLRAFVVCEKSLATAARELGLGGFLKLGKGEAGGGGAGRDSILSDAFEALIGAVYLDGGIDPAREFISEKLLKPHENTETEACDYKTVLQEHYQKDRENIIEYKLVGQSGPDHMRVFEIEVLLNGKRVGAGGGKSKKEAEQRAARQAMESVSNER